MFAELGAYVEATRARYQVPGVAVGAYWEGREYTAGYGVTNIRHPLAVDGQTLFQIGSITKTMTATVVMRLVEMGCLALDTPLRTYLPELRMADAEATEQATMRHLLTHVAGWAGDYFDDLGRGEDALARYVTNMAELPQWTPLGAVWSYNNSGFSLAGRVIEAVYGKPFETAATELVLAPLGMTMSFFFAEDVIIHRTAVGHAIAEDETIVLEPWALARTAHAAGGVISTAQDLLRYARFHMGDGLTPDGARLLSAESVSLMQTEQAETSTFGEHVGLSWMLRRVGDLKIVTHGGGTNGQISLFLMAPERQFALAVLTNAVEGGALTTKVAEWALRRFLDVSDSEPEPRDLSEAALTEYVGRYSAILSDVEISLHEDGLLLQQIPKGGFPKKDSPPWPAPPPVPMRFVGKDRFMAVEGPTKGMRFEALRGDDGTVRWVRLGGRIHARQAQA
jgi:CubicO group peptidase (beta-lactamase class C family)